MRAMMAQVPSSCACDMFAEIWVALRNISAAAAPRSAKLQIEMLMDRLSCRQVELEMLDKRCIKEARRHKASGMRAQFRSNMLEHRQLQGQLTQLQRYRENALAQLDAVSNHEINQTFLRAIQGAGLGTAAIDSKETKKAIDDLQETVANVREISDLLGHPLSEGIDDDDLELEFADLATEVDDVAVSAPPVVVSTTTLPTVPSSRPLAPVPELRTMSLFS